MQQVAHGSKGARLVGTKVRFLRPSVEDRELQPDRGATMRRRVGGGAEVGTRDDFRELTRVDFSETRKRAERQHAVSIPASDPHTAVTADERAESNESEFVN